MRGSVTLLPAFHTVHFLLTQKNVNVQLGLNEIRKVNSEMIGSTLRTTFDKVCHSPTLGITLYSLHPKVAEVLKS